MGNINNKCQIQGVDKGCENTLGYAPYLSLAMAYVPDQEWTEIYEMPMGLERGTIFKQLDKPFVGRRCV